MEEKSLEQMKRELQEFYFKKVKAHLSDINKIRKHERINTICALLFLIGFTGVFLFGIFSITKPVVICVVLIGISIISLMVNNNFQITRLKQELY